MKRRGILPAAIGSVVVVCALVAIGLVILGVLVGNKHAPLVATAVPTTAAFATLPPPSLTQVPSSALLAPGVAEPLTDAQASADAVAVVKRVTPAVVTVLNMQRVGFLGIGGLREAASGTGFIIDQEGHIVTNWHVVNGGAAFDVILADGTTRPAKLLGSDSISDLAVVQIAGPIPGTVPLGDSAALLPGQTVLAIGSPLGQFTNTVTKGIVSALGRSVQEQAGQPELTGLIQHDAPINPGNSGGPLLDLAGQVVGVNTLGIPQQNGQPVQGIFFAIPSNTVKEIAAKLIESGKVAYPYFGITSQVITPDIASQNDLPVDHGVYVAKVVRGGPAADAGIQQGDIILAINGVRIDAAHPFTEVLFHHQPGETVTATVQRGSRQLSVRVMLGERPGA